jgi:outer membrane immunogenic protein
MKTLLLTTAAFIAFAAVGAVGAADLPINVPIAPVAPIYNWTGCYVGVHGGGGVQYDTRTTMNGGGGLAGGQLGCNYQDGQFVLGVEAEGWWSGLRSAKNLLSAGDTAKVTSESRWGASFAVRTGVAINRVLIFGKVGGVVGRYDFSTLDSFSIPGFIASTTTSSGGGTLAGLLIGGGFEYAFATNWTAKIEYNFIDYIHKDLTFVSQPGTFTSSESVSASQHIVKVGINYKFDWGGPVTARY